MADRYTSKCYREALRNIRILTPEEEHELCAKIQAGDKSAQHKLIEGSLRTVWQIAHKYATDEVDLFDLIQEGNLGLIHAAERFDINAGVRFNTYAIFWIRQKIQRFYHNSVRSVRIPVYKEDNYHKVKQFIERFTKENGHVPHLSDIAEGMGKSEKNIAALLIDTEPCASLDYTNEHDTNPLAHVGDMRHNPETACCKEAVINSLQDAMTVLDERELEVIKMRFGFYEGKEYTLTETAEKFGITYEWCRQIQIQALKKMKDFYASKKIRRI